MISTVAAPASTTIRRLAAVAFADVVGFSALVERNDVAALQEWKDLRRELIEPKIEEHHGRIMRMLGDGMFIEFGSAVDAVRCAQENATIGRPKKSRAQEPASQCEQTV